MTSHTSNAAELNPGRCWRAVLARDARWDGAFVYAVRSTRVFCRPSCPSRRPRRQQTLFFTAPAAAELAGFRACRRCRPQQAVPDPSLDARIAALCRFIEARHGEKLTLPDLSARTNLSSYQLLRAFKRVTGITPRQYAAACRLGSFKTVLKRNGNVTASLYEAGYGSSSRLYEHAPRLLGMTPGNYRRGGLGMHIQFTTTNAPLGRLLVAATERGISMVCLGGSDAALEAELRREYPRADIRRNTNGFTSWVRAVLAQIEGQAPSRRLPVDVQATAFQRRVWQELIAIPRGAVRSYAQIARAVGHPRAVRAVARACATNPAAVVVPCHRAVRSDGSLGGYRWGLSRKRALLNAERRAP